MKKSINVNFPLISWESSHQSMLPSGGATYRSGCSQEHPDLKKILKKNLYLIHIRNTLNHKIRNTLELKKKNYLFYFQGQKKKKPKKKIELKSKKKKNW